MMMKKILSNSNNNDRNNNNNNCNKNGNQFQRKLVAISTMASLITVFVVGSSVFAYQQRAYAATLPDYHFSIAGDWGCNSNTQTTVNGIVNKKPNMVIADGDFSYQDTADCWFSTIQPINSITKAAIGNHETVSSTLLNQYMNHFGLTSQYYSFNKQNIHFLIMSIQIPYKAGSEQYNFVNNDLQKASTDPNINWIVVAFHRDASYTSPNTFDSGTAAIKDTYHPIFDKYHVDLVLQAHNHNYQRTYPITYNTAKPSSPTVTSTNSGSYTSPKG
jgi:hypothetical protein